MVVSLLRQVPILGDVLDFIGGVLQAIGSFLGPILEAVVGFVVWLVVLLSYSVLFLRKAP